MIKHIIKKIIGIFKSKTSDIPCPNYTICWGDKEGDLVNGVTIHGYFDSNGDIVFTYNKEFADFKMHDPDFVLSTWKIIAEPDYSKEEVRRLNDDYKK